MKIEMVIFVLLFFGSCFNEILELTQKNKEILTNVESSYLLYAYQENCKGCLVINTIIFELERQFKSMDSKVILVKFDIDKNDDLYSELGINTSPLLRLIVNPEKIYIDYEGEFTSDKVVNFVKKHLEKNLLEIKDLKEIKEKGINSNNVILYCGDLSEKFEKIKNLIRTYNFDFVYSNSSEIIEALKCNETNSHEIFYHPLDPNKTKKYNESSHQLEDWIVERVFPLVNDLTPNIFHKVFDSQIPTIIYFAKYPNDLTTPSYLKFYQTAKFYKKDVLFVNTLKSNEDIKISITNIFNIQVGEFPLLLGIRFRKDQPILFKLGKNNLSEKNTEIFIRTFVKGTLKPYIISSLSKEDQDEGIESIVANNLRIKIEAEKKDVLLLVNLKQNCQKCVTVLQNLKKIYKKIKKENIAFKQIDYSSNEIFEFQIGNRFPTILIFKEGENKIHNFIELHGVTYSSSEIYSFIKNNSEIKTEYEFENDGFEPNSNQGVLDFDLIYDYESFSKSIKNKLFPVEEKKQEEIITIPENNQETKNELNEISDKIPETKIELNEISDKISETQNNQIESKINNDNLVTKQKTLEIENKEPDNNKNQEGTKIEIVEKETKNEENKDNSEKNHREEELTEKIKPDL